MNTDKHRFGKALAAVALALLLVGGSATAATVTGPILDASGGSSRVMGITFVPLSAPTTPDGGITTIFGAPVSTNVIAGQFDMQIVGGGYFLVTLQPSVRYGRPMTAFVPNDGGIYTLAQTLQWATNINVVITNPGVVSVAAGANIYITYSNGLAIISSIATGSGTNISNASGTNVNLSGTLTGSVIYSFLGSNFSATGTSTFGGHTHAVEYWLDGQGSAFMSVPIVGSGNFSALYPYDSVFDPQQTLIGPDGAGGWNLFGYDGFPLNQASLDTEVGIVIGNSVVAASTATNALSVTGSQSNLLAYISANGITNGSKLVTISNALTVQGALVSILSLSNSSGSATFELVGSTLSLMGSLGTLTAAINGTGTFNGAGTIANAQAVVGAQATTLAQAAATNTPLQNFAATTIPGGAPVAYLGTNAAGQLVMGSPAGGGNYATNTPLVASNSIALISANGTGETNMWLPFPGGGGWSNINYTASGPVPVLSVGPAGQITNNGAFQFGGNVYLNPGTGLYLGSVANLSSSGWSGPLNPTLSGSYSLGSASATWNGVYAVNHYAIGGQFTGNGAGLTNYNETTLVPQDYPTDPLVVVPSAIGNGVYGSLITAGSSISAPLRNACNYAAIASSNPATTNFYIQIEMEFTNLSLNTPDTIFFAYATNGNSGINAALRSVTINWQSAASTNFYSTNLVISVPYPFLTNLAAANLQHTFSASATNGWLLWTKIRQGQ